MDILLQNEKHGTEVRLEVELPHVLSKHQQRRVRKELCGRKDCDCGVVCGPQQFEVTPVHRHDHETWAVDWWAEGESPFADAERALREAGYHEKFYVRTEQIAELVGLTLAEVRSSDLQPSIIYVKSGFELYARLDFLRWYRATVDEKGGQPRSLVP